MLDGEGGTFMGKIIADKNKIVDVRPLSTLFMAK